MSDLGIVLSKSSRNDLEDIQNNDAYTTGNTRLNDFITKTSDTEIASDIIDPLCTFDIELEFTPNDTVLKDVAEKFKSASSYSSSSASNQKNQQLVLNLSYYVQSMTIPQMVMPENGKVPTLFGEFPVNNLFVKPDNNTFTMTILNTKMSLHDFLFYPWMREVTLPRWSYDTRPYTTAKITVKFDKHNNSRYVFAGCRPTQVGTIQPTQEPEGAPTRDVTMLFDYMFIFEAEDDEFENNYYDSSVLKDSTELFSKASELQSAL